MQTPENISKEIVVSVEQPLNPADQYIEQEIRPLLGDEIANFWRSQTNNWSEQFVKKTWHDLAEIVGNIPEAKVTNPDPQKAETEANNLLKFKMGHWMFGGNIEVAGNLAITLATDSLRHTKSQAKRHNLLKIIGGSQARLNWEAMHRRKLKQIERQPSELQDELKEQENKRYGSAVNKLTFLQKSQTRYVKKHEKLSKVDTPKFNQHLERKNRRSTSAFNKYSHLTDVMVGRDDKGNFQIHYRQGAWDQLALTEEPLIKSIEDPRGISLSFYRYNPDTGEKEFFVCFGKKDTFARTLQLTPAWQTSLTRAREGNHPGQDYNPMLNSLQQAFTEGASSNGIEFSFIDINPNRLDEGKILVVTNNWDTYDPKDQGLILDILKKEGKGKSLHAWIPESKIAMLRRKGMVDKNGYIGPAVNGFMAIALGTRSPKEILEDAAGRKAQIEMARTLLTNPEVTLQSIQATAQKLLEQSPDDPQAQVMYHWLQQSIKFLAQHKAISEQFPHQPHELKS